MKRSIFLVLSLSLSLASFLTTPSTTEAAEPSDDSAPFIIEDTSKLVDLTRDLAGEAEAELEQERLATFNSWWKSTDDPKELLNLLKEFRANEQEDIAQDVWDGKADEVHLLKYGTLIMDNRLSPDVIGKELSEEFSQLDAVICNVTGFLDENDDVLVTSDDCEWALQWGYIGGKPTISAGASLTIYSAAEDAGLEILGTSEATYWTIVAYGTLNLWAYYADILVRLHPYSSYNRGIYVGNEGTFSAKSNADGHSVYIDAYTAQYYWVGVYGVAGADIDINGYSTSTNDRNVVFDSIVENGYAIRHYGGTSSKNGKLSVKNFQENGGVYSVYTSTSSTNQYYNSSLYIQYIVGDAVYFTGYFNRNLYIENNIISDYIDNGIYLNSFQTSARVYIRSNQLASDDGHSGQDYAILLNSCIHGGNSGDLFDIDDNIIDEIDAAGIGVFNVSGVGSSCILSVSNNTINSESNGILVNLTSRYSSCSYIDNIFIDDNVLDNTLYNDGVVGIYVTGVTRHQSTSYNYHVDNNDVTRFYTDIHMQNLSDFYVTTGYTTWDGALSSNGTELLLDDTQDVVIGSSSSSGADRNTFVGYYYGNNVWHIRQINGGSNLCRYNIWDTFPGSRRLSGISCY